MTFAAPWFLLAALAAAIPVVLHLANRRHAKEVPFPTLRFLKVSVQKTRRRKRIQDLLLMLLRAALLLLVAAGLARPIATNFGTLWGDAGTAVVIVLDNSASMGMIDRDRLRLDTAIAAAVQILDQLDDGDRVALIPTCGPPFPDAGKMDRTQQSVRQILQQCQPSYERANLVLKLRQARKLLDGCDSPNKQIFVLTDMQRASWDGGDSLAAAGTTHDSLAAAGTAVPSDKADVPSTAKLPPPIPVIIVDCDQAPKPDAAVERVTIETPVVMIGLPVKVAVTVLNASTVPQQRLFELTIDGVKRATSPRLELPPGGHAKHEIAISVQQAGLHRGEVRLIGEDGSRYDDRRFFTLETGRSIPVAVVESRRHEIPYLDDAFYIEQALAAGLGGFRVAALSTGDLPDEPLDKYKVIFCVNVPALSNEAAARLADYVDGGGNLVWIVGDNVDAESYNQMNRQTGGRLLPATLLAIRNAADHAGRDSWHVGFLDEKHPALKNLAEPPSLYESVLVYRHVRLAADETVARVLARLDDGEPLLVERGVGDGRVLMLGIGAAVDWSNLPLRPIFMPLLVQLTSQLSDAGRTRTNLTAGQPLEYRFNVVPPPSAGSFNVAQPPTAGSSGEEYQSQPETQNTAQPRAAGLHWIKLIPPGGEMLQLETSESFRFANTHDIGIYELRIPDAENPIRVAYTVNFDPAEADPAKIEAAELDELLGGAPLLVADDPDDLTATFVQLREGNSLWGPFLLVVLFALVFETFLSNRFGSMSKNAAESLPR